MATDVRTMNLSDNGDGMVSLNNNQGTSFVPNIPPEKNVSENKQTMDSTSISDIMGQEQLLEPPMMSADPRMEQMQMQAPMMMAQQQQPVGQQTTEKKSESKNPFNLTDDQFEALIVAVCAAAAISKPVQEKLANFVPSFLNDQGNRSAIGLASTGMVAAIAFYVARKYA
jgi:transcriptional regulator of aromatic amino acid metabolism